MFDWISSAGEVLVLGVFDVVALLRHTAWTFDRCGAVFCPSLAVDGVHLVVQGICCLSGIHLFVVVFFGSVAWR